MSTDPRDICDSHIHLFGPAASYPWAPDRSYTPDTASGAQYRVVAEPIGITRAVVVQPSVYGTDNRRTLAAVKELGATRTRAIAVIEEHAPAEELHRLHDAGVRGLRFNQIHGGGPKLDHVRALAARAASFDWHLQVNAPASELLAMAEMLSSLPVRVVLDHIGRPDPGPSELAGLLRLLERPNIWIKLCWYRSSAAGPPYDDMRHAVQAIAQVAGERCVWGSDWPHVHLGDVPRPDIATLLALIDEWIGDAALRDRVLRRNAELLYGFADG